MTKYEVTDALEGIELTEEGKQEMRDIVFIHDEKRAEIIDDQVRYFIIQVLKRGIDDKLTTETKDPDTGGTIWIQREVKRYAMSVVEIVKMAKKYKDIDNITKNQVYHHLPKLIDGGFVVKYGTVVTGKRTTDYYQRTAKGFVLTTGQSAMTESLMKRKVESHVEKFAVFDINLSEAQKKELANLLLEGARIESQGRSEIAKLVKGDVADKEVLSLYEDLVMLHALGNDEWVNIQRRIREILLKSK
ncbi:MAG: hypothetical protein EAX95_03145 [Candidatus Thorarchaeota archaeon]|nr:hypothetical protein [Candidatus Thorarchaeota archaeon]